MIATYKTCGVCGKPCKIGYFIIVKLDGYNIKQYYHKRCFDEEAKEN